MRAGVFLSRPPGLIVHRRQFPGHNPRGAEDEKSRPVGCCLNPVAKVLEFLP